jgi:transposase
MSRRPRRNHTPAFKAKVALAAIKGDRTVAQLAEQFDVHANQVTLWKAQLEGGAADVFGPGSGGETAEPAVDVKSLHAKIGKLTLENDFLEGALTKAGLLSAKRCALAWAAISAKTGSGSATAATDIAGSAAAPARMARRRAIATPYWQCHKELGFN